MDLLVNNFLLKERLPWVTSFSCFNGGRIVYQITRTDQTITLLSLIEIIEEKRKLVKIIF